MKLYNKLYNKYYPKGLKLAICKTKVVYGPKKYANTFEHIVPRKLLKTKQEICDLHNMFGAPSKENNDRGSKKFSEIKNDTKSWYLKEDDRGCISRAIIYMYSIYNSFDIEELVYISSLFQWFLLFPPTKSELLHNMIATRYLGHSNPLISKYDEACIILSEGFDKLVLWIRDQIKV